MMMMMMVKVPNGRLVGLGGRIIAFGNGWAGKHALGGVLAHIDRLVRLVVSPEAPSMVSCCKGERGIYGRDS